MNHFFKLQSLQSLVKANGVLLGVCGLLAVSVFVLSFKLYNTVEKITLIPTSNYEKRIEILSRGYAKSYLEEWALYVMQQLMTTSEDTVDRQIADLKQAVTRSQELKAFFEKHTKFVKGNKVHSVFWPKSVALKKNSVLVTGEFRYWFGSSQETVSQTRQYRVFYKEGPHGLLLLDNVRKEKKR